MKRSSRQSSGGSRKRQRGRHVCGHCGKTLGSTQYHEHKKLYYNSISQRWTTKDDLRLKNSAASVDLGSSTSSDSDGTVLRLLFRPQFAILLHFTISLHHGFYLLCIVLLQLKFYFIEGEIDPETQAPASCLQDVPGSDSGLTFCFFTCVYKQFIFQNSVLPLSAHISLTFTITDEFTGNQSESQRDEVSFFLSHLTF